MKNIEIKQAFQNLENSFVNAYRQEINLDIFNSNFEEKLWEKNILTRIKKNSEFSFKRFYLYGLFGIFLLSLVFIKNLLNNFSETSYLEYMLSDLFSTEFNLLFI